MGISKTKRAAQPQGFAAVTLFSAILIVAAPVLRAQVVGSALSGTVRDDSGGALPDASVTIKNVETGAARKLVTDAGGRYFAPSITVGRYEITASKEGFSSQTKTGVELVVGQSSVVDLTLPVGVLQQEITVEEAPAPVTLSTQQSSGLVSEKQVKDLPLNGRSYDGLLTLNPGVLNYTGERSGGVGTSNAAVGNMYVISGHRAQENLFLLNGIEYTGASEINLTPGGASGQLLGVEAVREFNVVTDTYGAEYGKRSGGQISIVTASGTNQLHGSIYEFLRNSDLDARNFFDQGSIPQFQRNDFGAALGGPIQKDKTFVFGNYEGFRQHWALSELAFVPDHAAREGIVSGTNVGVAPAAAPLLSLWPMQNGQDLGGGIGEAFSHPLQTIREDFGTLRLDHNFSDKDTLFGVYTVDDSTDNTPTANPFALVNENLREQVLSLQEQHVFSPTLLNTARTGFSRGAYYFNGTTPVNIPGWVMGDPIGAVIVGGGTASNGASQITGAGTNAGDNLSIVRNLYTYEDHVTYTRGIHQFDAGGWLQQIQANDNMAQDQYGQASFTSLTSLLQGTIATFTVVPTPTPLSWRSIEGAGYAQDVIKLRRNLELRIGFRFESTNGWNEAHGRAANYLFQSGVIDSNPQLGGSAFTVNRAKFLPEPRTGLAWDPFGKGKTVIRTGFGIYRALLDDLDYRLDQIGPFNTTLAAKNVSLAGLQVVPGATSIPGGKVVPSGIQPDAYTPTVISYTFKIEQTIAPNTSLGVGYSGSHGYHELLSLDANEPVPTICPAAGCPANLAPRAIFYPAGVALANPNLANTTSWFTEGVSSYNALIVDVNHRFNHGLQFRGVYTLAKNLDDGTAQNSSVGANAPGFVMFPHNPKIDWGLATTDVRNSGVINATYELPFGAGKRYLSGINGWEKKVLGGWNLSGILTLQSGFPFTPQLGYNPAGNGDSRNPIRPELNPAFNGPIVLGGPNQYFNPNAFLPPATGTLGNVGRDTLIGPGITQLDFSLTKTTPVSERIHLQFRAEFFNILNHANFGTPNAVVYASATSGISPTAGVISSTSTTSRQIQFGLKLLW